MVRNSARERRKAWKKVRISFDRLFSKFKKNSAMDTVLSRVATLMHARPRKLHRFLEADKKDVKAVIEIDDSEIGEDEDGVDSESEEEDEVPPPVKKLRRKGKAPSKAKPLKPRETSKSSAAESAKAFVAGKDLTKVKEHEKPLRNSSNLCNRGELIASFAVSIPLPKKYFQQTSAKSTTLRELSCLQLPNLFQPLSNTKAKLRRLMTRPWTTLSRIA